MPVRQALASRPATEWVFRGLLAVAFAIAGYVSVARTLAHAIKKSPERAHRLAPEDGRIAALLARKLSGPEAAAGDRARADQLARHALQQDPSAVIAAATLGFNAQVRGDTARARRLFAYSEALSRRDFLTQLWAIEDAVARNDIPGALSHYDKALRTSRSASGVLFPVLAAAVADPAIRSALTQTLARGPSWSALFIEYLSNNSPDLKSTAIFFRGLQRAGIPVSALSQTLLINTMISRGLFEEAWSYYASVRAGADRRSSRDPNFAADPDQGTLFDWTPINDTGIVASIQRDDNGGLLDFAASPSAGGALVKQMQMLPPGNYRLEGKSIGIEQLEGSRPYWVLSCSDGRELGRVVIPNSATANGVFSGQFGVPTGCRVQTLALVARPSDTLPGVAGQIDQARLYPVR